MSDRSAGVSERGVERVSGGLNRGGLAATGEYEALALGTSEIPRDGVEPLTVERTGVDRETGGLRSEPLEEREGDACDVGGAEPQAVIGHLTGDAEIGLDHVEPVHSAGRFGDAAAGELTRVGEVERVASEEVGVEREDDVGLAEVVAGLERAAVREARALVSGAVVDRGPGDEAGFRKGAGEALADSD